MKSSVYYCGFARFEHDPPGHTCGLPCCREDAGIEVRQLSAGYSCMPTYEKILEDNFTFRKKRCGLIAGRPTFSNKFFSLQNITGADMVRQRGSIPDFGDCRPDLVLTASLENPFMLKARPGVRKGEFMCRREICLPDSPQFKRKFIMSDPEFEESLDFCEEEASLEYYTTLQENIVKIDEAMIKGHKMSKMNHLETKGKINQGFVHTQDDVTTTLKSSDHYYDVLAVVKKNSELETYQIGRHPNSKTERDPASGLKQIYVNTLARKKPDIAKFDTFPCRAFPAETMVADNKMSNFQLWNQWQTQTDNYYEDIEFKQLETNTITDAGGNVTTNNGTSRENKINFRSFGYYANTPERTEKSPESPIKQSHRHDSLKDSPITLIL